MPQCPLNKGSTPKMFATRELVVNEDGDQENNEVVTDEQQEAEEYFARVASPLDAISKDKEESLSEPEAEDAFITGDEGDIEVDEELDKSEAESNDDERMGTLRADIAEETEWTDSTEETEWSDDDDDIDYRTSYYSTERFGRITIGEIEDWESQQRSDNQRNTKGEIQRPYPPDEVLIRPRFNSDDTRPMVQLVSIGGILAFTMFDSGCTTQSVSPEFARVAGLSAKPLTENVPLQLGTAGSKGVINHGLFASVKIMQSYDPQHYFDVVNLDRYDAIIGTRGMRKLGITLDFESDHIQVRGQQLRPMTEGEEKAVIARRYAMRQSSKPMIAHRK